MFPNTDEKLLSVTKAPDATELFTGDTSPLPKKIHKTKTIQPHTTNNNHLPFTVLFIQIFCCGCWCCCCGGAAAKIGAATGAGCGKESMNGLPSCSRSSDVFFATGIWGSVEKKSTCGCCDCEEIVDAEEELLKKGLAVWWDGGETFDCKKNSKKLVNFVYFVRKAIKHEEIFFFVFISSNTFLKPCFEDT